MSAACTVFALLMAARLNVTLEGGLADRTPRTPLVERGAAAWSRLRRDLLLVVGRHRCAGVGQPGGRGEPRGACVQAISIMLVCALVLAFWWRPFGRRTAGQAGSERVVQGFSRECAGMTKRRGRTVCRAQRWLRFQMRATVDPL